MIHAALVPAYLFVLPWSLQHLGGVNQVVINLAREMQRAGSFEPIVLIDDWNAPEPVWEHIHGLRTVRWCIRPFGLRMGIKERLAFGWWLRKFRPAFRGFCEEHRVAAINPHYPGLSVFTLEMVNSACAQSPPLILSFHGTDLTCLGQSHADDLARWRQLLLRASNTVVCSIDMAQRLVETFGAMAHTTVIHNGLDASAFVAMAGGGDDAPARPTILNVAKFEGQKGQDVLIKAFAELAKEFPAWDLVLVGATDKALEPMRALCHTLGVADRVKFYPDTQHQQVANFFRRASVFVLPSRQESFGIVLLEAGAFSLPVIASRVGGIPEILTDGETGCLVPADDVPALAKAMRTLLTHPARAASLGQQLQRHVQANFDWSQAHDKYARLVNPGWTGTKPQKAATAGSMI
jgi:glycosyltransferase involved in cell wall biosynthesis